jgi:Domain of unknown function (DUF6046)
MAFSISINELARRAFSTNPNFDVQNESQPIIQLEASRFDEQRIINAAKFDSFPLVVLATDPNARILFPASSYQVGNNTYTYESLLMPEATLVEFSQQKTIVETAVAGRSGKVKEIIAKDDWEITIRGVITTGCFDNPPTVNPNQYPGKEVGAIKNICNVDKDIEVIGNRFQELGIQRVVIKSLSLPVMEDFPYVQPFVITAVSDSAFELTVAQNNDNVTALSDFQNFG